MRKGTAMKLLRMGEREYKGTWQDKCDYEAFWRQLAFYLGHMADRPGGPGDIAGG
ncbi:MAG: hypothetical protein ABII82_05470 [Verrucomicrobiota bacterium]